MLNLIFFLDKRQKNFTKSGKAIETRLLTQFRANVWRKKSSHFCLIAAIILIYCCISTQQDTLVRSWPWKTLGYRISGQIYHYSIDKVHVHIWALNWG